MGREVVGNDDQTFAIPLAQQLPEEVIGGQSIAAAGKEPGEDEVMLWISGGPEDFVSVMEEESLVNVNLAEGW